MKVAILGAFPIYDCAEELGINPRAFRRISSWNENLVNAMVAMPGLEVHFITATRLIPSTRTVRRGNLSITFFVAPRKANLLTVYQYTRWAVNRLLGEIKPDLVHGIGTEHIWPYIAVTSSFRSVVTVHGVMSEIVRKVPLPLLSQKRFFAWLEKRVMRRTRHLITISPYVEESLGKYTSASLYPVENPINEMFFRSNCQPDKGEYILFVGSIERRKALDVLVDAFGELRDATGDNTLKLVIAGTVLEEEYAASIMSQIADRGFSENIRFCGFLLPCELADMYSRASFLVLPSIEETAPMCISEAMAAGVPVVCTEVGGTAYMLESGKSGFLVRPGDIVGLADSMKILLKDPNLRRKMGHRAKELARQRWMPKLVAENTVEVYRQVLQDTVHD